MLSESPLPVIEHAKKLGGILHDLDLNLFIKFLPCFPVNSRSGLLNHVPYLLILIEMRTIVLSP